MAVGPRVGRTLLVSLLRQQSACSAVASHCCFLVDSSGDLSARRSLSLFFYPRSQCIIIIQTMADEATINPDGSQTFETPPAPEETEPLFNETATGGDEEAFEAVEATGVDPAIYVLVGLVFLVAIYFFFLRKKRSTDDFFYNLDGEKVCRSWNRFH